MKTLKRILIGLLVTVFVVLVLTMGTLVWVFHYPGKAFSLVQTYILPEDLKIVWQSAEYSNKLIDPTGIEIEWKVDKLKITQGSTNLSIPIEQIRLHARIFPLASGKKLFISNLKILAPHQLTYLPTPSEEPQEQQNLFQMIQSYLNYIASFNEYVDTDLINIEINKFSILAPKADQPSTDLKLFVKQPLENKNEDIISIAFRMGSSAASSMQIKLEAEMFTYNLNKSEPLLNGKLRFTGFGVKADQNINLIYQNEEVLLSSQGPASYSSEDMKILIKPKLDLISNADETKIKFTADLAQLPGPVATIENMVGELVTPNEAGVFWSQNESRFSIKAPVNVFFVDEKTRKLVESSCACKVPRYLDTEVSGKVWLSTLMSDTSEKMQALDAKLEVEVVRNSVFLVDLAATINIEKQGKEYLLSPVADSLVEIYDFKSFRTLLDAKKILIPAPFDILGGTLSFSARGPVETNDKSFKFPLSLVTNLNSSNQKIVLQTEGFVDLARDYKAMHINTNIKIQDFQIELPPLDPLGGVPRVAADTRIVEKKPKPKKEEFKLTLDLQIETVNPGAIRLLSRYFKPYLPISLNIKSTSDANRGSIQVEAFDVVYLRRTVSVRKFILDLNRSEEGVFPIDGRFRIKQTHYTVFIDVEGTAKEPIVTFTSRPDLPRSEIISVLLYDRTSDQLVSADAETAGSVEAAISDKAIGLFGLWAFASTPIRSFHYNPVTKVYSATVALADDLTAGVGTNWESATQFELQKRVSRRWVLTASLTPATEKEEQVSRIVLQWEKRF